MRLRSKSVKAILSGECLIVRGNREINVLRGKRKIGTIKNGVLELSPLEGIYLMKKGKIKAFHMGKEINVDQLLQKVDFKRYHVFEDLTEKGYLVKSGHKYGADFRVYEKGDDPDKEHSSYLVRVIGEVESVKAYDLLALARVAHSVRKKLILAIVGEEGEVTYYSVKWTKL
ncbi:MAG TPA: tRNA-intron lyase [Euryarchaeota archaeon]|nr:tRNA-intron lyase [Euryarchaeota archaeon]